MRYADKLRLPQWKEFRRQVLEARGCVCEDCGTLADPPHVHHKGYVYGREPWEYSFDEVKVLCEPCHEGLHERRNELDSFLGSLRGKTLKLFLTAISRFISIETNNRERLSHQVYSFFKHERFRLEKEAVLFRGPQDADAVWREVRNDLLQFSCESLDGWLNGTDVFNRFPEEEQLKVAENLARFVDQLAAQTREG